MTDLRTVGQRHPECLKLMLNKEIIAVNQDSAALQPQLIYAHTNITGLNYTQVGSASIVAQAFMRPLSRHRIAVVVFNRATTRRMMEVDWKGLAIDPLTQMSVRDIIRGDDLGVVSGKWVADVESHGVYFVVLTPL